MAWHPRSPSTGSGAPRHTPRRAVGLPDTYDADNLYVGSGFDPSSGDPAHYFSRDDIDASSWTITSSHHDPFNDHGVPSSSA